VTRIESIFAETIEVHGATLRQTAQAIQDAADLLRRTFEQEHKVLAFGNGGSAADAQHLAAEFVNRFQRTRRALAAIALTADTSVLTSIANDSSYERVFARQIEALGQRGDVALAISTSGKSPNVVAAISQAREQGLRTIALFGQDPSNAQGHADVTIVVPSSSTARVQEVHRTILHVLCELVEA
jgi:D-sedoheptulose 7-phosphate isomerase